MSNGRRYQRYAVMEDISSSEQPEVIVATESVRLANFSVGGLYILSKSRFSISGEVNISVKFENHGKIDLTGRIVRVKKEGEMWGVAIDLSKNYNLHTLKEV